MYLGQTLLLLYEDALNVFDTQEERSPRSLNALPLRFSLAATEVELKLENLHLLNDTALVGDADGIPLWCCILWCRHDLSISERLTKIKSCVL